MLKLIKDIELSNYEIQDHNRSFQGRNFLYISKKLNYKRRKDLEIYKSKNIESTFIEIINERGKNTIVGCIYKHHTISPKDFTELMSTVLPKILKEKKICYLAGDFNRNLLQLENNSEMEHFFDELTNQNFTLLSTTPTRITINPNQIVLHSIMFLENAFAICV